ncbi:hypothetical protein IWZ01DRAFT_99303 [Phyllosticta capitalensis]
MYVCQPPAASHPDADMHACKWRPDMTVWAWSGSSSFPHCPLELTLHCIITAQETQALLLHNRLAIPGRCVAARRDACEKSAESDGWVRKQRDMNRSSRQERDGKFRASETQHGRESGLLSRYQWQTLRTARRSSPCYMAYHIPVKGICLPCHSSQLSHLPGAWSRRSIVAQQGALPRGAHTGSQADCMSTWQSLAAPVIRLGRWSR